MLARKLFKKIREENNVTFLPTAGFSGTPKGV